MRFDFSGDCVLAVVAHPDDAELLCAGALARAKADGAPIGLCVMCRGDKGQPAKPVANLGAVRKRELSAATKLLGAQLYTCGYGDSTLVDDPPRRTKLIEIYRKFRPTLVLAHAPEDYHPDHRAASAIAEAATWLAAARGHKTRSAALDAPPAVWWMDCVAMTGFAPGFYLDVSQQVELKRQMLACHASQMARSGSRDFAPLAELMERQLAARGAQAGVDAAEAYRVHHAFKRTRAW